jgi:hypothetical protein
MPHTISTKPAYSLRFWRTHRFRPPKRNVFDLLEAQAGYRYETPPPKGDSIVFQSDMRELPRMSGSFPGQIRCVITSPPYFNVTAYEEDQWLRLWFLGGPPHPTYRKVSRDDRHEGRESYWTLIVDMWRVLGAVLGPRATVVIRIGAVGIGPKLLVSGLEGAARAAQRKVRMVSHTTSEIRRRQTEAFRPGARGCKLEVDCQFSVV